MSLPLPRRIAQVALLLGAAAAPLVGAGAAHAAAPQPNLGGLSNLDGAGLGNTVQGASHQATTLTGQSGTQAMKTALPAADRVVGTTAKTALPTAQRTAGNAGDSAGRIVGATAESAGTSVPGALPAVPNTGALPLNGIHTDQLPLG
ncbi:ATP-binding protein [Streptomyces polygonati]|uniref:ATP-binding protein n=1 Tax=Streptomyces polygonati TaxID=1617087 RepID=A0ABV8HKP7_9ACTN